MAERFLDGSIQQAVLNGEFGTYLSEPYSSAKRAELVGENLAFMRKKVKLSQKDVCEIIDCKPQTYSGYEKGKHEPSMETLVRLSWLYNVSLDFLLGRNTFGELFQYEDVGDYVDNLEENDHLDELHMQVAIIKKEFEEFRAEYKKHHPDE